MSARNHLTSHSVPPCFSEQEREEKERMARVEQSEMLNDFWLTCRTLNIEGKIKIYNIINYYIKLKYNK